MKIAPILPLLAGFAFFVSCTKQQSEEERNAQIEREVQQRIAAERQTDEQQRLAQQQADLDAREKALVDKESAAAPTPIASAQTRTTTRSEPSRDERGAGETTSRRAPAKSYEIFYDRLEQYGDWRETSDYGYVWQPREAQQSRSWRPYTEGHWVYTNAGWTWISNEPYGWATCHYGRWTRLRGLGWIWVPGDQWAPAWVAWRTSNDYVGWAPLPPDAAFDRGVGIHKWADSYYDIGPDQYAFVPVRELGSPQIARAVVPLEQNVTIVNQTVNVTNITYNNTTVINQGPNYEEFRARSVQPIERYEIERRTEVNAGNAQPVVRGRTLEITEPELPMAQQSQRPRNLKGAIPRAIVDYTSGTAVNQAELQRARAKMKAETTPPPNAPPKEIVRARAVSAPTVSSSPSPSAMASIAASPTPAPSVAVSPLPTSKATATASSTQPHSPGAITPLATATPITMPPRFPRPPIGASRSPSLSPNATASIGTSPGSSVREAEAQRNAQQRQRDRALNDVQRAEQMRQHEGKADREQKPFEAPSGASGAELASPAPSNTGSNPIPVNSATPRAFSTAPVTKPMPVETATPVTRAIPETAPLVHPATARMTPPRAIITPPPQEITTAVPPLERERVNGSQKATRNKHADNEATPGSSLAPPTSPSPTANSSDSPRAFGKKNQRLKKRLRDLGEPGAEAEPEPMASPSPTAE